MYNPNPIDTSSVALTDDLLNLTEIVAENVHDNWAAKRLSEGWVYGEVRDDRKKTTPCLVPYSQLPEEEREYDRKTALQTLKLIVKLGYTIEKR